MAGFPQEIDMPSTIFEIYIPEMSNNGDVSPTNKEEITFLNIETANESGATM